MSDLQSLLPPNATDAELALEGSIAGALNIPAVIDTLWKGEAAPETVLPFLAWAYSIDFWRTDWSDARKRSLTAAATELHRYKGTRHGFKRTLEALGFPDSLVQAWYEYPEGPGDPYSYRVDVEVSELGITDSEFETVERALLTTQSARDKLDRLRLVLTARNTPSAISTVVGGETINILPFEPDDVLAETDASFMIGISTGETIYLEAA